MNFLRILGVKSAFANSTPCHLNLFKINFNLIARILSQLTAFNEAPAEGFNHSDDHQTTRNRSGKQLVTGTCTKLLVRPCSD